MSKTNDAANLKLGMTKFTDTTTFECDTANMWTSGTGKCQCQSNYDY